MRFVFGVYDMDGVSQMIDGCHYLTTMPSYKQCRQEKKRRILRFVVYGA